MLDQTSTFDRTKSDGALEAETRAVQQALAILPEPAAIAHHLSEEALIALCQAQQTRDGWKLRHGVRDSKAGDELFRNGCVDARSPRLGAYGIKVRRYIRANMGGVFG